MTHPIDHRRFIPGCSRKARAGVVQPLPARPGLRLGLFLLLLSSLVALAPGLARADIGPAARAVPSAELVGEGRMTFLGFRIFDAALYAPSGTYDPNRPFALKLTYLRNFSAKEIAERTRKEMKRQGMQSGARLDGWISRLQSLLPNVTPGTSITGVRDANGNTILYNGSRQLGTVTDKDFTRRFFNIWLGTNTSDRSLRNRLVGAGS